MGRQGPGELGPRGGGTQGTGGTGGEQLVGDRQTKGQGPGHGQCGDRSLRLCPGSGRLTAKPVKTQVLIQVSVRSQV